MPLEVFMDYETRSRVDLKACGAHRYAIDPSTEILMAAVGESPVDAPAFLWINPKYATAELGQNGEAEDLLSRAALIHAHNCPFEQAITWGAAQNRKPSPFKREPGLHQWRDTAAVARKAALPWALDKLGEALNLPIQKDARGKTLIRFFCVPKNDGTFNDPAQFPEKWNAFCDYCRTDMKSERLASHRLSAFHLSGAVLESFLFDLRMNQRGIPVNVTALRNAQRIIDEVERRVTTEFVALTGLNPTQREEVRKIVNLPNMQAETIQAALLGTLEPRTRRILELYQKLSYAAVKKVATMLECACPDGHVRGGHLWYGTGPGRHSGRLIQPQNFRKTDPEFRPITKEIYGHIADGWDVDMLESVYGDAFRIIANSIRHFIHKPGVGVLDGDYSAIQARIICWLARQDDALQRYRDGKDTYKWMASRIYDIPESAVNSDQREVGKRAVLGCGFQMGPAKFQSSCLEQYGLDLPENLCERAVYAFRDSHPKIRSFWYELDTQAKSAIRTPGMRYGPFLVRKIAGIIYLLMSLPSGRAIAYPHPEVVLERFGGHIPTSFEEEDLARSGEGAKTREQITYWGQLPLSVSWGRVKLYGGKLAENLTMGVEADVMNHGLVEAERRGMPPFMLVHDQALALRENGCTGEDFADALLSMPSWAHGLPVKVDASVKPFYAK